MKHFINLLVLSSVLMACSNDDPPAYPVTEAPIQNEVRMNFIGDENQDKYFGVNSKLSSVECRYDSANKNIRVVAYRFSDVNGEFTVEESLRKKSGEAPGGNRGAETQVSR